MDVDSLFLRGKEAADGGNYDYAIAIFLDILKQQPEHLKSLRALRGCEVARFQEQGGSARLQAFLKGFGHLVTACLPGIKPEKVADACERYLVNDPTSIGILRRLGAAYEKRGLLEAATDTLEFARQRAPDHIGVLRQLGALCQTKGDYEKAVRCFQEIVRIKPADRNAAQRAKSISAEAHLQRSHMVGAESFVDTLKDKDQAKTLELESHIAHSTEEKDAQVAERQKAADANPSDPEAWRDLGDTLFAAERFVEAEKAFVKEFELTKRYNARERLGETRRRRLLKLETQAREAAEKGARAPVLVAAFRKARKQRLDFGVKEFRFRCDHHPTDLKLAWQLGNVYFERAENDDIQKAIKEFQRAMNGPGLRSNAQLLLARCFRKNPKTLDMARDQLQQAVEEVEDVTLEIGKKLQYELAGVEEELGETANAIKHYKQIYSVDAAYRDVAQKVQELS